MTMKRCYVHIRTLHIPSRPAHEWCRWTTTAQNPIHRSTSPLLVKFVPIRLMPRDTSRTLGEASEFVLEDGSESLCRRSSALPGPPLTSLPQPARKNKPSLGYARHHHLLPVHLLEPLNSRNRTHPGREIAYGQRQLLLRNLTTLHWPHGQEEATTNQLWYLLLTRLRRTTL